MILFAGGICSNKNSKNKIVVNNMIENVMKLTPNNKYHTIKSDGIKLICGNRREASRQYYDLNLLDYKDITGFLYGNLYKKESGTSFSSKHILSENELEKITETKGKYLSDNYWGEYILLYHCSRSGSTYIFPDPMGFSCLYYVETSDGVLFSSDVWCIRDITKNSLNTDFLRAQINSGMGTLATSLYTPFDGIKSLSQGYGLIYKEGKLEIVNSWDPFAIYGTKSKDEDLGNIIQYSVNTLIKDTSNVCLELSGGLDSGALLMLMKNSEVYSGKVSPISYYSSLVSSSDERVFAREFTELCNIDLFEQNWQKPWDLTANKNMSERLDRPHTKKLSLHLIKELEDIFSDGVNLPVFCSGHGGDHMFCGDTSSTALADYWIDHKFNGFFKQLNKLSNLERKSYKQTIQTTSEALKKYYSGDVQNPVYTKLNLPNWLKPKNDQELLETLFAPPFLEKTRKFWPSKYEQIIAVYTGLNQYKLVNKLHKYEVIYPFYSQLIVEYMLRVPIYEMYNEEYNRIILRECMTKKFPVCGNKFYRKSKGDTTAILQLAVEQNEARIKELCLEGRLVSLGEIDRDKLEEGIKVIKYGKLDGFRNLFHLIAIELWLEEWDL